MNWIKLHTGVHRNPKVRIAQAECAGAREVFILLLCINGEHEFEGLIPMAYCSASYISAELGIDSVTASRCVTTLRDAGLLHEFDDPAGVSFAITGYTEEWMPLRSKTSADRAKRYRKRKKLRGDSDSAESASRPVTDRHVTRYAASPKNHASRGVEERRVEENRSIPPTPQGGVLDLPIPISSTPRFDFESVYRDYPCKEDKASGMKKLEKDIQSAGDFEAFRQTVSRYVARERAKGTEAKFYKRWGTLANQWRGMVAELGEVATQGSKPVAIQSNWRGLFRLAAHEAQMLERGETPPWWTLEARWNMKADLSGEVLIPVKNGRRADAS